MPRESSSSRVGRVVSAHRELSKRTPYTQSPGPSSEALLRIISRSSSFDDASNSDRADLCLERAVR